MRLFFASDMNGLMPLVFTILLDGGFVFLFLVALVMPGFGASQKSAYGLLQFLAGAGVFLVIVVAGMGVLSWHELGYVNAVAIGATVLLEAMVFATWRGARRNIPEKDRESESRRDPENW